MEHEITIVQVPDRSGYDIAMFRAVCSCGDMPTVLRGWYMTERGAEAWKARHLRIVAGDTTSTSHTDQRARDFLEKVEDAQRRRIEAEEKREQRRRPLWERSEV